MIRVGIDATSVAPDGKGIARVQRGTVRALAELGRFELVVYARHPEEIAGARRVTIRPTLAWEQAGEPPMNVIVLDMSSRGTMERRRLLW